MADIRDLPVLESNIFNDFFIFQRDNQTTYRINQQNLLANCIKYSDHLLSLIGNVPWNYISFHPEINVILSGNVHGQGSIHLGHETELLIDVSYVNIPTQLSFTPVQQGGGQYQLNEKIYMGWSGEGVRIQVNQSDLGPLAFKSDLTWANIRQIPEINVSVIGAAIGSGSVNLAFSNQLTINLTEVTQSSVLWDNIHIKPTIRCVFPDTSYQDINFNDLIGGQFYILPFDTVMARQNDIRLGSGQTDHLIIRGNTGPFVNDEYHFKIERFAGPDHHLEFFNTIGGRDDRQFDRHYWIWDIDQPGDIHNICYKNRIEMWPLLVVPHLMVEKERVVTLAVDTLIVESDIIIRDYGTVLKESLFSQLPIGLKNQFYGIVDDHSNRLQPRDLAIIQYFCYSDLEFQLCLLEIPDDPLTKFIIHLEQWLVYYWNTESTLLNKWEISTYTVEDIIQYMKVIGINPVTHQSYFIMNSNEVYRMTPAGTI